MKTTRRLVMTSELLACNYLRKETNKKKKKIRKAHFHSQNYRHWA